jgi:dihydrolipoamide dehydrogenase
MSSVCKRASARSSLIGPVSTAGRSGGRLAFDLGPAQERSRKVAEQMNKGIGHLFKKNKVTHVQGYARLAGKGAVEVDAGGKKSTLQAKHIILATGSRPKDLPFLKIDEDRVISSTGALMLAKTPATLAVVGAGAVGIEFADVFNAYGSKVTIIEALDRILPIEDADCSAVVEKSFKKRGMDVFTGARLEKAELGKTGVKVTFKDKKGETHQLQVERVLSAVGRTPNTEVDEI